MKQEHTPTPWRTGACITNIEHWPEGWNAPVRIADCHLKKGAPESCAERVANAALIIRAVNAHDDLVRACEAALELIGNMPTSGRGFVGKLCTMKQCEAALAKARG